MDCARLLLDRGANKNIKDGVRDSKYCCRVHYRFPVMLES